MIMIGHGTGAIFTRKYTGATLKKVFGFPCMKKPDAI